MNNDNPIKRGKRSILRGIPALSEDADPSDGISRPIPPTGDEPQPETPETDALAGADTRGEETVGGSSEEGEVETATPPPSDDSALSASDLKRKFRITVEHVRVAALERARSLLKEIDKLSLKEAVSVAKEMTELASLDYWDERLRKASVARARDEGQGALDAVPSPLTRLPSIKRLNKASKAVDNAVPDNPSWAGSLPGE